VRSTRAGTGRTYARLRPRSMNMLFRVAINSCG
jgi:hypothetical protein